jgi:hypothetical protein
MRRSFLALSIFMSASLAAVAMAGAAFAQAAGAQGLAEAKRAQAQKGALVLAGFDQRLSEAMRSGDGARVVELSEISDVALPKGAFVAGVEPGSAGYEALQRCEKAAGYLRLMTTLAEGIATKQPEATASELNKAGAGYLVEARPCLAEFAPAQKLALTQETIQAFSASAGK